jgi:hypothetical protein
MFFLKIIQLLKPIIILLFLRWLGFDVAVEYVFLSSVYIIYLELINVFAPTDRLYLSSSSQRDLMDKIRYRYIINFIFFPFLILFLFDKVSLWFLVFFVFLVFISAEVNCYYSYFLNRIETSRKSLVIKLSYESFVWFFYSLLLYLIYIKYVNVEIFVLLYILESVFSKMVVVSKFYLSLSLISSIGYYMKNKKEIFGDFCFSGVLFTWMNYFYRVPFLLGVNIDPLYILGAQAVNVLYNMQLSFPGFFSKFSFVFYKYSIFLFSVLLFIASVEYFTLNSLFFSVMLLGSGHAVLLYVLVSRYTDLDKNYFKVVFLLSIFVIIVGFYYYPLIIVLNTFLLMISLKVRYGFSSNL